MAKPLAVAKRVKKEVVCLNNNPPVSVDSPSRRGWNIVVKRVYDPEAVAEGRRIMRDLAVQALLNKMRSRHTGTEPEES